MEIYQNLFYSKRHNACRTLPADVNAANSAASGVDGTTTAFVLVRLTVSQTIINQFTVRRTSPMPLWQQLHAFSSSNKVRIIG